MEINTLDPDFNYSVVKKIIESFVKSQQADAYERSLEHINTEEESVKFANNNKT